MVYYVFVVVAGAAVVAGGAAVVCDAFACAAAKAFIIHSQGFASGFAFDSPTIIF